MSLFDGVKNGDWACTAMNGWGKVYVDESNENYPIVILTAFKSESFTYDGCYRGRDKAPTAWPEGKVPQYYLDIYGPPPKKMVKKKVKYFLNLYCDGIGEIDACGYIDEERAKLLAEEQAIGVAVPFEYEYEVEE